MEDPRETALNVGKGRRTMIHAIRLAVFVGFSLGLLAPASAQSCGPVGGLEFVCGPKNAEDLVRVPGTGWIIASGMTEGASLTLIDSRNRTYSALRAQAGPDATFANCATPPDAAKAITHGLNLHAGANGELALIDGGAVHYGWAAADLAMLVLFSEPPPDFFGAYESACGIDSGWRAQVPLLNLYHLLNHLNLFGSGYLNAVRGVLRRFG